MRSRSDTEIVRSEQGLGGESSLPEIRDAAPYRTRRSSSRHVRNAVASIAMIASYGLLQCIQVQGSSARILKVHFKRACHMSSYVRQRSVRSRKLKNSHPSRHCSTGDNRLQCISRGSVLGRFGAGIWTQSRLTQHLSSVGLNAVTVELTASVLMAQPMSATALGQ